MNLETTEKQANHYLEIETKYNADDIDRNAFKQLFKDKNYGSFLYVESTDIYFTQEGSDFLRYRMPSESDKSNKRAELTLKRKHSSGNNIIRTEVNLRIDLNTSETVIKFCEELGYKKNFEIYKMCDIYFFDDSDVVFYTVIDEQGKYSNFIEIEANEKAYSTPEEGKAIIRKYEEMLEPLGLSPQRRLKKSLWELYKKDIQ